MHIPTLKERRMMVMSKAHAAMAKRREEWKGKIVGLAEQLPLATDLDCPPAKEGATKIHWNEKEQAALLSGIAKVKGEVDFIKWDELSENAKTEASMMIFRTVMYRILPDHRHRDLRNFDQLPIEMHDAVRAVFGLTPPESTGTTPAPILPPEPPKPIIWTDQERAKMQIQVAWLMRKSGIRIIPEASDRLGNAMFCDAIRLAQTECLPRHRHINLSFARGMMIDFGMLPGIERVMKLPEPLKPIPKDPELDEIMAQPRPPEPVRNGTHEERNGHHASNGNGAHPPKAAPEPAPLPPKIAALAEFTDAEIFTAASLRLEGMTARMAEIEQTAKEATEFNALLTEENQAVNLRHDQLKSRVEQLEELVQGLLTAPERTRLPRVAILGCRKDEFDKIEKMAMEAGIPCQLRHYEQQQSKVMTIHADYAIAMPGMSHSQDAKIRESVPRGQYIFMSVFSVERSIGHLRAWFQPELVNAT